MQFFHSFLSHTNWQHVQKMVEATLILGWEHWLSQTEKTKAGSTVELLWLAVKLVSQKLFKKGATK